VVSRRGGGAVRGVMRILVVAADPMELRNFPKREDLRAVAGGVGARCAAAAVDGALEEYKADAVMSTGFCGALDPELKVGDVVVGAEVVAGGQRFAARAPAGRSARATGAILSIDHVVGTSTEKARLFVTGAIAVEMEAGAVAERAAAHELPFYCIKVVTDLASEDMANDFNSALRPDGHFDTMVILRSSMRQPLVRIPELIRLRKRCARAALLLGEFIADCRF
jgi:adenosylhomocysteine nucleosidase